MSLWGGDKNVFCTLFPLTMVLSHWVFLVRFLTRQIMTQKNVVLFFLHWDFFPLGFFLVRFQWGISLMDIQGGVLWICLLVDVHPLPFHMLVTPTIHCPSTCLIDGGTERHGSEWYDWGRWSHVSSLFFFIKKTAILFIFNLNHSIFFLPHVIHPRP